MSVNGVQLVLNIEIYSANQLHIHVCVYISGYMYNSLGSILMCEWITDV